MVSKGKSQDKTITGRVIASDWDEDDNVVGLVIEGDIDDYVVNLEGKGKQLLDYINEVVSVTGMVRKEEGEYSLTVKQYKVLEDEALEDDEDLDDEDLDDELDGEDDDDFDDDMDDDFDDDMDDDFDDDMDDEEEKKTANRRR